MGQKYKDKEVFYPSLLPAIILIVGFFILDIISRCLVDKIYVSMDFTFDIVYLYIISGILVFLMVILSIDIRYELRFNELFELKEPNLSKLFVAVTLFTLGGRIFANDLYIIMTLIKPVPESWMRFFNMTDNTYIQQFILAVIMAPVIEELLFRGIVLRGFLKHYSLKKAIVLSSLLFAMVHLNIWQGSSAFVLGIVYSWIYIKTKSIKLCIYSHALHNFLVTTTSKFVIIGQGMSTSMGMIEKAGYICSFVIALAAGVYLVYIGNIVLDKYGEKNLGYKIKDI